MMPGGLPPMAGSSIPPPACLLAQETFTPPILYHTQQLPLPLPSPQIQIGFCHGNLFQNPAGIMPGQNVRIPSWHDGGGNYLSHQRLSNLLMPQDTGFLQAAAGQRADDEFEEDTNYVDNSDDEIIMAGHIMNEVAQSSRQASFSTESHQLHHSGSSHMQQHEQTRTPALWDSIDPTKYNHYTDSHHPSTHLAFYSKAKLTKASKQVYALLREDLTEPVGQRLRDISTKLKSAQEGESDFLDDEWIAYTWARLKKDLINEIRKRDSLIEFLNSPSQGMNGNDLDCSVSSASQDQLASVETVSNSGRQDACESKVSADPQDTQTNVHKVKKLSKADQFLAPWQVGDKVESCDCQGAWYRATILGVSYSRRQVMVNFAGWDSKWDEWIKLSSGRVRNIQCPEAPRIRKDGTPIFPKHRSKERQEDMQSKPIDDDAEPAQKLSREEQRELDRVRRKEKEEMLQQRRQEMMEKRKNGNQKPPTEYQRFIKQEIESVMKEKPRLTNSKARKIAHERWKRSSVRSAGSKMGIVVGSVYQLYACLDEETPEDVAEKLKVDAGKLISINKSVYPDIRANTKLMEGTLLKLPARVGTGEPVDVKIFAKVQSVKKTLTLTLKQNDRVSSIKKQIRGKEGIAIKEQTVVFSGQRLDDLRTLADYNIGNDSCVYVQVGSEVFENSVEEEIVEVEYDCGWMQTPSGQKFLASDDGQQWLQTSAGKLWTQQTKEREQQEAAKNAGEVKAQPKALNNFNNFMKEQVPLFRRIHKDMSHKTAWERAIQMWRVSFAPNTMTHRLEWGKLPSVVSWSLGCRGQKSEHDARGDEADSVANANKKKNNTGNGGVAIPDEISDMVKSNQFNFSYDWNYREKHLSRTAKKAARISLTTDTIEMMTCELQGMDDRYDGSGWTTWKKRKTEPEEKKVKKVRVKGEKNGAERKPRSSKLSVSNEVNGVPKAAGPNMPRWFKTVPRCPELLLPPCEETYVDEGNPRNLENVVKVEGEKKEGQPETTPAADEGKQAEAEEATTVMEIEHSMGMNDEREREEQILSEATAGEERTAHLQVHVASAGQEREMQETTQSSATTEGGSKRESETIADSQECRQKVEQRGAAAMAGEGETSGSPQCGVIVEQKPWKDDSESSGAAGGGKAKGEHFAGEKSESKDGFLSSTSQDVGGPSSGSEAPVAGETRGIADLTNEIVQVGEGEENLPVEESKGAEEEDARATAAEDVSAWLPLPCLPSPDGEAGSRFFKLPYPVVKDMKQREFEDEACKDSTSEFPTPFVPISKNVYVGEERAALRSMESRSACQCIYVPGVPETACGEHSNCMLRDLYIECDHRCPCSSHCLNKRLQKRQWARCSIFLAKNGRGWALRNDEDLRQGQLVMEYIGEVISGEEVARRMVEYAGKRHTYMLKLNQEEFIDSTR
eukprot:763849-Hanusia_phi.AAC.4